MGIKIREKRGKLYLDIYAGGKRKWEALHLTLTSDKVQNKEIMRLAEIICSTRETQILSEEWDIKDVVAGKKSLVKLLEEEGNSKTGTNKRHFFDCIRYLKKYNNGDTIQVSQITPKWIDDFQQFLLKEVKVSSAAVYMAPLRWVLKKAVRDNIILRNPAESVKGISKPDIEIIFLNKKELEKLYSLDLDEIEDKIRRAFIFACYTGLRVSDLKTIKWKDIEYNQIVKKQKKTQKAVYIPIHEMVQMVITNGREHNPDEKIFTVFDISKSDAWTNHHLKKFGKRAGISKPIGWHTARRTFATMCLESGVDIYTVAKLLGHTSIKQVAKYAQVTDKLRQSAIASLPNIELVEMVSEADQVEPIYYI